MKSKNNNRLFAVLLIVLAAAVMFGAYRVFYRPIDRQIKKTETEIAAKEAEYQEYLSAEWESDVWKKTVEGASSLNGSGKLPKSVREQDQIRFITLLEKSVGFNASIVKTGTKSLSLGGGTVMYKPLSFDYRVDSYGKLCDLISSVCHDGSYPSSVVDFSMELDDDGGINGMMNIRNYYDPQNGESSAVNEYAGVPTGVERLFINE